jgi:Fe-S-cluster containining protein
MITKEDLISALKIVEPMFEKLDDVYRKLPDTRCECDEPGTCCRFLPEMTTMEALRWFKLLIDLPDEKLTEKLREFVRFYFSNPVRLTGCPFLENGGGCSIYPQRTFACRAYGIWSQKMGRGRTRESRKDKENLRAMWKQFGIELPKEIVDFEIDYCDKVELVGVKSFNDKKIMKLLQQAYDMDQTVVELQTKFENEYHSDFSLLMASLALGMKKALLEKLTVVKECVQEGGETRLQKLLEQVTADAIRM